MATISMTALAVHCSGLVQTASPLTHRQARTTGTEAVRTRAADFPTDSQSTPPSRRLRTPISVPPFSIAASAVARAKPACWSGPIKRNDRARLANTAPTAANAGVLVSCSE